MRLLFEECLYKTSYLHSLGLKSFSYAYDSQRSKCSFVGYYRSYSMTEPVFVLPKVFVTGGLALSRYDPETLCTNAAALQLSLPEYQFVKTFAERLYFALKRCKAESDAGRVTFQQGSAIKSNLGTKELSSFEAMLSLIEFNRENPYVHLYQHRMSVSQIPRVVDWKKTFSNQVVLDMDKSPVVFQLLGTSPAWQRSDPLLVIYYSLLKEFSKYDPSIATDPTVQTLNSKELAVLYPRVPHILKNRRSMYFSDKVKKLHALLLAYFSAHLGSLAGAQVQFLIAESFQGVFERLVDSLLSDEELLTLYKHLKDGKEIDHLFGEKDIFRKYKIIFIGDSKYYKEPAGISSQRYKQFTYARNIIQENIYVINRGGGTVYSRNYRDPITEGYNVTPNFFVFGIVNSSFRESQMVVEPDSQPPEFTYHFPNRLFDRDTLHVLYFKADLLRLLRYYVASQKGLSASSLLEKTSARAIILSSLASYLNKRYFFYNTKLTGRYISSNFKQLIGKVFISPATSPRCILALERSFPEENESILRTLKKSHIECFPFFLDESLNFQ